MTSAWPAKEVKGHDHHEKRRGNRKTNCIVRSFVPYLRGWMGFPSGVRPG